MAPPTRIHRQQNRLRTRTQLLSSAALVLYLSFQSAHSAPAHYTSSTSVSSPSSTSSISTTVTTTTTWPLVQATHTTTPSHESESESEFYSFEILNPAPNDIWISGTIETLSWVDSDLPDDATFDITLVPAHEEEEEEEEGALQNSESTQNSQSTPTESTAATTTTSVGQKKKKRRRRPVVQHVSTIDRFMDLVVPYDLISDKQLEKEQLRGKEGEGHEYSSKDTPDVLTRLIMTVYEGRSSKVLARRDVFPIKVRKDHERDWRKSFVPLPSASDNPALSDDQMEEEGQEEGEDEESPDHAERDFIESGRPDMGIHDHEVLDEEDDLVVDPSTESQVIVETHQHMHGGQDDRVEGGGQEHKEEDAGDEDKDEEQAEGEEGHHHSHLIDPNHFQNQKDIEIWKEHESDLGYNPPIEITDAGTLNITHWVENKKRFYLGAPYVLAWDAPENLPASSIPLSGTVSVYVEDALTAERYDIVAANLPSDVQFLYLHPTRNMMTTSPIPEDRVLVRARVELDLFWKGNILRFTGMSKIFYVEQGAI